MNFHFEGFVTWLDLRILVYWPKLSSKNRACYSIGLHSIICWTAADLSWPVAMIKDQLLSLLLLLLLLLLFKNNNNIVIVIAIVMVIVIVIVIIIIITLLNVIVIVWRSAWSAGFAWIYNPIGSAFSWSFLFFLFSLLTLENKEIFPPVRLP